jgi:hypothetical protein
MGTSKSKYARENMFLRSRSVDESECDVQNWTVPQRERLKRIMDGDNAYSLPDALLITYTDEVLGEVTDIIDFDGEFDKFHKKVGHNAWQADASIIFFRRYPSIVGLKVLRRQLSGLCFMHAPVVLQHYLVAIETGATNVEMIDVASYIGQFRKGSALLFHIKENFGGNAEQFMREINYHVNLETDRVSIPDVSASYFSSICEDLMSYLTLKPALVSNFRVDDLFLTSEDCSFSTTSDSRYIGNHAMVLIGMRRCPDKKFMFLLQNWWEKKFFIEVSASYMKNSDARITMFKSPIPRIPTNFPCVRAIYAETSVDQCDHVDEM